MSKTILPVISKDFILNQAIINIDADIESERIIIIDRLSTEVYYNFKLQSDHTIKFIVPLKHSSSVGLLVGIIDDDHNYNCEFVDGVIAEIINGNIMNIRP